jgi:hypothetical protein
MRNKAIYPLLAAAVVLIAPGVLPAQEILIQVRAFQATWSAERHGLSGIEVLSSSSDPRLFALKERTNGTESDLRAASPSSSSIR